MPQAAATATAPAPAPANAPATATPAPVRHSGGSPYTAAGITKAPNWGALTALDILLNNLAVGTFLAAVTLAFLAPARFEPLLPWALILSLLLLGADLLLLVLDLGDPRRFHHMLRVFKPRAPMSLGTWSLTVFSLLLGLGALASVLQLLLGWPLWEWLSRGLALLAVIPALGSILYKGVLFSTTSQAPWQDARWLGGYFSNSALLLGSALLLAGAALLGLAPVVAALRPALFGLLLLDSILFFLLYRGLSQAIHARYESDILAYFWLSVIAFGWVAPVLLLLQGFVAATLPLPFLLLAALIVRLLFVLLPRR
jgi:Ni/Fe-hydrogenase subunit HybB-like protein